MKFSQTFAGNLVAVTVQEFLVTSDDRGRLERYQLDTSDKRLSNLALHQLVIVWFSVQYLCSAFNVTRDQK